MHRAVAIARALSRHGFAKGGLPSPSPEMAAAIANGTIQNANPSYVNQTLDHIDPETLFEVLNGITPTDPVTGLPEGQSAQPVDPYGVYDPYAGEPTAPAATLSAPVSAPEATPTGTYASPSSVGPFGTVGAFGIGSPSSGVAAANPYGSLGSFNSPYGTLEGFTAGSPGNPYGSLAGFGNGPTSGAPSTAPSPFSPEQMGYGSLYGPTTAQQIEPTIEQAPTLEQAPALSITGTPTSAPSQAEQAPGQWTGQWEEVLDIPIGSDPYLQIEGSTDPSAGSINGSIPSHLDPANGSPYGTDPEAAAAAFAGSGLSGQPGWSSAATNQDYGSTGPAGGPNAGSPFGSSPFGNPNSNPEDDQGGTFGNGPEGFGGSAPAPGDAGDSSGGGGDPAGPDSGPDEGGGPDGGGPDGGGAGDENRGGRINVSKAMKAASKKHDHKSVIRLAKSVSRKNKTLTKS